MVLQGSVAKIISVNIASRYIVDPVVVNSALKCTKLVFNLGLVKDF